MRYPLRSYVICAVTRSGSNLLCDGLLATRRAGNPQQLFSHLNEAKYAARYHPGPVSDYATYVRAVIKGTATSNRVFGFKLMGWNLAMLLDKLRQSGLGIPCHASDFEVLTAAFPRLQFVRLSRRDKLRQAVSKARAMQTGVWKIEAGRTATGQPSFDPALISQCLREEQIETAAWDQFFATDPVTPLTIDYEQLCRDYRGTLRAVLEFLHISLKPGASIPEPKTIRQSGDALASEWEERYRAELASP